MIAHVALELLREQADDCAAFWELLGFERVEPPGSLAERSLWLEREGTQVHLLWTEEPVHPPRGHVAVVAAGFEATVAALEAAGHEVEPRRQHWGAPRSYVRDPAGNLVEVMERAPNR